MWPVGWRVPCKLRMFVDVEWMGVWSGCQVNVRNESYIPWRWFSDSPGFQQVDEKLYYSNSAAVAGILLGVKLTQEYYLISKSKYQVLMDGMKLWNPVDFERPFEIICINRSDGKIDWVHFWWISTSAYLERKHTERNSDQYCHVVYIFYLKYLLVSLNIYWSGSYMRMSQSVLPSDYLFPSLFNNSQWDYFGLNRRLSPGSGEM